MLAPQAVIENCTLGLSRAKRLPGATEPAIRFAAAVAKGQPIEPVQALECTKAHKALAGVDYPAGPEPAQITTSRLLWGGDEAYEWAKGVWSEHLASTTESAGSVIPVELAPTPPPPPERQRPAQPIAAAVERAVPFRAEGELFTLDQRAVSQIETAFWSAYRTALRAAGELAERRAGPGRRVPIAAQAEAGLGEGELNDRREAMAAAHPYDKWPALGGHIAAAIDLDLDAALVGALDDFEETASSILSDAREEAVGIIALALGVTPDDVRARMPAFTRISEAAQLTRTRLHEWVRLRLAGDRPSDELPELTVPSEVFRDTLAVAGGAVIADGVVSRETTGSPIDTQGNEITDSIAGAAVDLTLQDVASGVLQGLGALAGATIRRRYTWVYGQDLREDPFEPHLDLDGSSWTSRDEGPSYYPGDHPGCKCRLRRTWEVL